MIRDRVRPPKVSAYSDRVLKLQERQRRGPYQPGPSAQGIGRMNRKGLKARNNQAFGERFESGLQPSCIRGCVSLGRWPRLV